MVICKHIQSMPSVDSFYSVSKTDSSDLDNGRFDDARLSLIILTKLLEYVQYRKIETLASPIELNKFKELSEHIVLSMSYYLVNPVTLTNQLTSSAQSRFQS